MAPRFQAPRGTRDLLPEELGRWQWAEAQARGVLERYGYGEIRTPLFEDFELFARTSGESSDVVQKEMYRFKDLGDRDLALRPEFTAGVMRAYLERGLGGRTRVHRLWSTGPVFRYGRPQKGRYRQFSQVNCELVGSPAPGADVEMITLFVDLYEAWGFRDLTVVLNSVGQPASRRAYGDRLRAWLAPVRERLSADSQQRLRREPAAGARHQGRGRPGAVPRAGRHAAHAGRHRRRRPRPLGGGARRARGVGRRLRGGPRPGARARLLHPHGLRGARPLAGRAERAGRRRALRRAHRGAGRPAHAGRGLRHRARPRHAGAGGARRRGAGAARGRLRRGDGGHATRAALALARELRRALRGGARRGGARLRRPDEGGRQERRAAAGHPRRGGVDARRGGASRISRAARRRRSPARASRRPSARGWRRRPPGRGGAKGTEKP